jgi:hypothetical protein
MTINGLDSMLLDNANLHQENDILRGQLALQKARGDKLLALLLAAAHAYGDILVVPTSIQTEIREWPSIAWHINSYGTHISVTVAREEASIREEEHGL